MEGMCVIDLLLCKKGHGAVFAPARPRPATVASRGNRRLRRRRMGTGRRSLGAAGPDSIISPQLQDRSFKGHQDVEIWGLLQNYRPVHHSRRQLVATTADVQ